MATQAVRIQEVEGKTPETELQDIYHAFFGVMGVLRMVRDSARYSHDLSQTAADISEVADQYVGIVESLQDRLSVAISEVVRKRESSDTLDRIVAGMATVAPEIDAMGQGDKLKTFELFGSMVDAAISEQAKA